ncbi:MAG: hypothetical protein AAFY71_22650 [Bacteroidota bacterium]
MPSSRSSTLSSTYVLHQEGEFSLHLCLEQEARKEAFAIRYKAYLSGGTIPENEEELFYDPYDNQANTRIFLVRKAGITIGTVRTMEWSSVYDWIPTSMINDHYHDLMKTMGAKTPLMETGRLAFNKHLRMKDRLKVRAFLIKAAQLRSCLHDIRAVFIGVEPQFVPFYRKAWNFEVVNSKINADVDMQGTLLVSFTPLLTQNYLYFPPYLNMDDQEVLNRMIEIESHLVPTQKNA